jgi:hypothetical protein
MFAMHGAAECADVFAGVIGAVQQLLRAQRRVFGTIFFLNAMTTAGLAQVFAQESPGARVQQTHTWRVSHCTLTRRPIHPGGAL